MAHLTLVGLSEDKSRLLLIDDAGHEFTLEIDTALRAALRGDPSRLGQLEIDMESALRPRDIQARIRAGETPEAVAQAARTSVDKIMPFAAPVLAERAHVAERAQRAHVRRKSADSAARTLADAVAAQLSGWRLNPDALEWDAFKRADGRWTLTAVYAFSPRTGSATFAFDAPGNFVTTEDDDARWLVGDLPEEPVAEPTDDLRRARERKLGAVAAEAELPLEVGGTEVDPDASTADLSETAARVREHPHEDTLGVEPPAEAFLDHVFAAQNPPVDEFVDGAAAVELSESEDDHEDAEHEPPHRRPVKKTRGRASVPSWDEIMFGGGPD